MKHLKKIFEYKSGGTMITHISGDTIYFDNGWSLSTDHEQDCCEHHYLDFTHISPDDYNDLYFDLSDDSFFTRIEGYGIQLNSTENFPLRIPGYGSNNGYYSSNLSLILRKDWNLDVDGEVFDISSCQDISE